MSLHGQQILCTVVVLLFLSSSSSSLAFIPPTTMQVIKGGNGASIDHYLSSASPSTHGSLDPLNVSVSSSGHLKTASMPTSEICPPGVTSPNGSLNPWEVHKFGGASLADATLYRTVGDLLVRESAGRLVVEGERVGVDGTAEEWGTQSGPIPTMAIVSARAGMTDMLVSVVDAALVDIDRAESVLNNAIEGQIDILKQLAPPSITDEIEDALRNDARDILSVVRSLRMIRSVPPSVMEVVTGFGEIWSARTLYAYLKSIGTNTAWLDARDVLVVKGGASTGLGEKGSTSTGGVVPLWVDTARRMEGWWETVGRAEGVNCCGGGAAGDDNDALADIRDKKPPIVIVTGFVATTSDGVPTTLKRSGSDYSATIFAKLVASSRVTMWKNTDGVYTADPRRVPEAFSIASLKYDEAMELAYFGAQVLHPSAMVPCIDSNIPVYVRNIFNPAFSGTVIQGRCASLSDANQDGRVVNWRSRKGEIPIKGITSVDRVSLLTLEGASVIGGAEVAERFMGAMASACIDVLIITQASSESSITVVVPESQGVLALAALRSKFELELSRSNVNSICLSDKQMSIVAIVGEGMAMRSGVSASFMSSLAKANVNIRVIAQGSSERQVAVVVEAKDVSRALRAAHQVFTLSQTMVSVSILGGTGKEGSALIKQLTAQKESLTKNLDFGLAVNAIASSSKVIMGKNGMCLGDCNDVNRLLESDDAQSLDLDAFTESLEADVNPHRVVIDCTNDSGVADLYERWMSSGVNIISSGMTAAAGGLSRFRAIQRAQRANTVDWQYDSSVASGLPILSTLRDLVQTGDEVQLLRGCLSGTMAYIFSKMSEDIPFSESVRQAIELDFTEIDVRDDLSGLDVSRKIVILARDLGLDVSVEDVEVESLITDKIKNTKYVGTKEEIDAAIVDDLKSLDASMLERYRAAKEKNELLRYKFSIDVASRKYKCILEGVDSTDTLFRLREDENLVAFHTKRYTSSPLIVKGSAAGPDLTASGMFADFLRLGRAFVGSQS